LRTLRAVRCRFLHRRVEGVKARPTRQKIGHSDNRRVR
jgi:hypothetical protein